MEKKYIHEETVHNLQAPQQIVPLLVNLFNPNNVIDVGCGLGTFLHEFQENGVKKIHGIDGAWADKQLLSKYISLQNFEEVDLEQPYHNKEKFDLAICLEVAEHLKPECAPIIVETLSNLSDVIIFSAAVPHQGGMNHINEQWPFYWEKLFNKQGYKMLDIIRPIIWNNPNIFVWYKQNMFVMAKEKLVDSINAKVSSYPKNVIDIIHPELYELKCKLLGDAYEGNLPLKDFCFMLKKKLQNIIKTIFRQKK